MSSNHPHHRWNSLSRRFQRVSMDRLLCLFVTMTALSVLLTLVHHFHLPPHSSIQPGNVNNNNSEHGSSANGNVMSPENINVNNNNNLHHHHHASMIMVPPRHELLWKSDNKAVQVEKKNKKGRVVHHSITQLKAKDFQGIEDGGEGDGNNHPKNLTLEQASQGREELIAILQDAGVQDMDPEAIAKLPTWKQVTDLYGNTNGRPVIYGLETCERFRRETPPDDASVGTAGLFNTGTNPLSMYLQANCEIPTNTHDTFKGMRWQVPWGKHMLASRKWTNTAGHETKANKTNVLPVVLIRDPYSWMQSMCKHAYGVKWAHNETLAKLGAAGHCPNLVPSAQDRIDFAEELGNADSVPVTIPYPEKTATFDSMVHFWSTWYNEYLEADYPRLMIRFEDLVFHQRELISTICECVGAVAKQEYFSYVVGEAKWGSSTHAGSSNMISAMIKYGTDHNRFKALTPEDMAFARKHVDPELMRLFQYAQPPLEPPPTVAAANTAR